MIFSTGGHLGDAVYQLYTVMKYGQESGFVIGKGQEQRWGKKEQEALLPLVEAQKYISGAMIDESYRTDCFCFHKVASINNKEDFYERDVDRWPGNLILKKRYFVGFFSGRGMRWILENFKRSEPWLWAPKRQNVDVVFHSPTIRLCRPKEEWINILQKLKSKGFRVVVIGGDDIDFWKGDYNLVKPKDLLEAADYINSAKMFIGGASCNYVIAEGLGKLRFVDVHLDSEGTVPFDDTGWNTANWAADRLYSRIVRCLEY